MASTNSPLYSGLPPLPSVPSTEPSRIALDAFRIAIADQVSKLIGVDIEKVYEGVTIGAKGCDCNLALARFRLKEDAKALAKRIAEQFVPNDYIAKAEANAAFVNFHFHTPTLARLTLHQINQLNHLDPKPVASTSRQLPPAVLAQKEKEAADGEPQPEVAASEAAFGYGTNTSGQGKRMLIDFSSPNIAKPFHAGHLRSTIIGMFIANVYTASGWDVVKMNYLGDWGKQYGLLAVGFERYGNEQELVEDPIKHLYYVYVKVNNDGTSEIQEAIQEQRKKLIAEAEAKGEQATILDENQEKVELTLELKPTRAEKEYGDRVSPTHTAARALFRKMEDGEPEAIAIWQRFRDLSIKKYKQVYARLNITFDVYWGESQVGQDSMANAIETLQKMNLVYEDKGALIIDLEKYKLSKTPVRKRDGTALYITRDIGGTYERYRDYKFDKHIHVVATQQELHFKQLYKTLELMEYPWAKNQLHVDFGMVLGMSTRKGTVVFLEDILDESQEAMHNQMRKNAEKYAAIEDPNHTSDVVAITAVKIQDMGGKRGKDYEFKWERMTSFEGDTGPYLQYAHVRMASVERKAAPDVVLPPPSERATALDTSLLVEPKARDILYLLATYPDVIKTAFKTHEPSNICTYLFRLCHAISSAWEVLLVRGQPKDIALVRLWLFVSAKEVLSSGMKILSLTPLERM